MFIYQAIILNSYSVICHSYCFSYECPFKKSSSGKRPKKKRFHGNRYEKKFKCESGTEFQKRSPEKSASARVKNNGHRQNDSRSYLRTSATYSRTRDEQDKSKNEIFTNALLQEYVMVIKSVSVY
ncbi:unnamed protein product [Larinioides sclopetarius]|uniref:Uncharacterized protein n=1 Tax=Larinioides sclopetarius TaxID=280406 RepID=A0AAV1Z0M1_9ARAC